MARKGQPKNFDERKADKNHDSRQEESISVSSLVEKAVQQLKKDFADKLDSLQAELVEVKESQIFLSSKYEELKLDNDKLAVINRQQEQEISKLKKQIVESQIQGEREAEKIDSLEQYGRRQNLEITGIPVKKNENTNKIVMEVAKLLNVEISPEQISTSHRIASRTNKHKDNESQPPPPIIARFVNRDVRNELYYNRKLAHNLDLKGFSVEGTHRIFVNENLTQARKKLFWMVKQKAKLADYKYFWTMNGNIYTRKHNDSNALIIKGEKDLDLIK